VLLIALLETVSFSMNTDSSLGIKWNCTDPISNTKKVVELDPFAILFIIVFGILVAIQFLCMFSHRLMTWVQLMSITPIRPKKKKRGNEAVQRRMDDMANIDAEEVVELVLEMANIDSAAGTQSSRPASSIGQAQGGRRGLAKKLNAKKYKKRTRMTMDHAFRKNMQIYLREAESSVAGSQVPSQDHVQLRRRRTERETELANKYINIFRQSYGSSRPETMLVNPPADYENFEDTDDQE
jgi:hypothetical protein